MKFWHEEQQNKIVRFKQFIKEMERDLADPQILHRTAVIWEVAQGLHDSMKHKGMVDFDDDEFSIYIYVAITPDEFQDMFDYVDETLDDLGYELDKENTNTGSGTNTRYRYENPETKDSIIFWVRSGVCKSVNTGRMVQETKVECNMIQA